MGKIIYLVFIVFFSLNVFAQNTLKTIIREENTKEPLAGVSVLLKNTQNGTTSDEKGFAALKNIPNGKQTIIFRSVRYRENEKNILFPQNDTIRIFL
ncbi:MAG TPA: carboxypeptidase-like regulatory domain-containing protein [Puia sp.]